jgi:hypothetical protein
MDGFHGSCYGLGIWLWPAKVAGKALKEFFNLLAFRLILKLALELVLPFVLPGVGTIWIFWRHGQPRR